MYYLKCTDHSDADRNNTLLGHFILSANMQQVH